MPKVYWAILKERHGAAYEESFDALADVIEYTARLKDHHRMVLKSLPVAHARNAYCQLFYNKTENQHPDDTLVMLDADHVMSEQIVERLAKHKHGVVGALATSRSEKPFIPFWQRAADNNLYALTEWEDNELIEGTLIGSGAIAIKRWVLYRLADSAPSWFRYTYRGASYEATEDMYFGYECERVGIPHWCDTSLWIPHCAVAYTTPAEWREYLQDHPETKNRITRTESTEGGADSWGQTIAKTIALTL
jgi:hypothetical protein